MFERSGTAASVHKPTCGQEPSVVGNARPTFRQCYVASVCKPRPREDHVLAYKAQWEKERESREEIMRLKSEGKKPAVLFEETDEETKPDENCKK